MKKIKIITYLRELPLILIACALSFVSCEDYLDKSPETNLSLEEIMKDFEHAEGFIESCYNFIVAYSMRTYTAMFLLDDEIYNNITATNYVQIKNGNYTLWNNGTDNQGGWFNSPKTTRTIVSTVDPRNRAGIWNGWQAIRIANTVIENIDLMTGATQTEKDLVLGQAYFFRAYFHHEIMRYWGRIPYIDKVLTGNNDWQFPRPKTYEECAMKADADFQKAADLLPYSWSDLQDAPSASFLTAKETMFANDLLRINKAIVYSYKGKNLLIAASPLYQGATSEDQTYDYNEELCEKAAEAFARVIQMDRDNVNDLGLVSKKNYKYCFYTAHGKHTQWPGTAMNTTESGEYIFSCTSGNTARSKNIATDLMPYTSSKMRSLPNHHFVHKTFGTANGLSCDEDPTHSFQNEFQGRDPRFYYWHIIDGDKLIEKASANAQYKHARMYEGGYLNTGLDQPTGYFCKKFSDISYNYPNMIPGKVGDNKINISALPLNMRLTDVYLMYAEALAATSKYGVTGVPSYNFMSEAAPSSIEVINMIRSRFDIPTVQESYNMIGIDITSDRQKFMDVVRRERSIELCYEGHRWTDIRRWMLAHLEDYKVFSEVKFSRDDITSVGDTTNFKNINFEEHIFFTKVLEFPKHYWMPFTTDVTQMYEGFEQNPGW